MQIINTLNKHATLAMLLAATGVPASMAQAQFRADYSESKAQSPSDAHAEHKVFITTSDDGEHKYEVKIIDGAIEFASIDGEKIDSDQFKMGDNVIVFLSEDGKVMQKIELQGVPHAPHAPDGEVLAWVSNDNARFDDQMNEMAFMASHPKVMLGINLGEPSDAVRKQLKLGKDRKVIFVERVIEGLPAQKAGLEDFDVILSIDGSDEADGELLTKVLSKKEPGDPLKLVVLRGGEKLKLKAKLSEYNAKDLGIAQVLPDGDHEMNVFEEAEGNLFTPGPELHERILKALHGAGLDEDQIAQVTERLHETLNNLPARFNSQGGEFSFRIAPGEDHDDIEFGEFGAQKQREMAEIAREKARQAMESAERQIMEMRDGRLFVRQADDMEDHLNELEDRLGSLEDRLNDQMDMFESQMERMADLFERLMDRLEDDED